MRAAVVVLVGACGGTVSPLSNHVAVAQAEPPDLPQLRALLQRAQDVPFDARARDHGCPTDQSLHEYVALLVAQGSAREIHHLGGGCGTFPRSPLPIDPPADATQWFCTIDASSSDRAGEWPWHFELHVRVRKADQAIDLGTVACPGA